MYKSASDQAWDGFCIAIAVVIVLGAGDIVWQVFRTLAA